MKGSIPTAKKPIMEWQQHLDTQGVVSGEQGAEPKISCLCFLSVNLPLTSFPLFPLGLLPLPGERVALHIFEPRYQRLLRELEENELEEFGIVYQTRANPASLERPMLGGIMRLLFATEPADNGARDAVLQCVNLLQTDEVHVPDPSLSSMYPFGDARRHSAWKNWDLPHAVKNELDILSSYWIQQGNREAAAGKPQSLIDAMVRYDFNPAERHQVLFNDDARDVETRFSEIIRFKALIVQQMQLDHRGQFPN